LGTDALQMSLNYLVGNTDLLLDKTNIERIQDIQNLTQKPGNSFSS